MQWLINQCYCESFRKNNNLKGYFEKQTKSTLFIRTSQHAANASPPNQNKVPELTFIIFSINLFNQKHLVEGITSAKKLIVAGLHVFMFFQK